MMQIIAKGTNPNKKHRGDLVQMNSEEKTIAAVKQSLSENKAELEGWENFLAYGTNFKVNPNIKQTMKGDPFKKILANNDYSSEGIVDVHLRSKSTLKQKEKKTFSFRIQFFDKLDQYGLPTLEIKSFSLKPIR